MTENKNNNRIAVALGDFDGMHTAHNIVVTGASKVIIYCVHNSFSLMQKSLFEKRFQNVVFADFDRIKNMSAEDFMDKILIEEFHAGIVLCGFNFRFGHNAAMGAKEMREYLEKKDVWVRILEEQRYKGDHISSTRIRAALKDGNITDANNMLGYNFTFEGEVVHGDERGRTINFPTINQWYPKCLTKPKFGVYESRIFIDNKEYKGFTNIGIRPSWKVDDVLSETHIFDFDGDLYGQTIRIEIVRFLREERVFSDVKELKKQLEQDKSSII